MNVYVASVCNVASDVRVDQGGGEIGWTTILGVATTKEGAQELTRDYVDVILEEFKKDNLWGHTYQEFATDVFDHDWRLEIDECELFENKLIHTAEGELVLH